MYAQDTMAEDAGEDGAVGCGVDEEREVEEREEDGPAGGEEEEACAVAHGGRREVVVRVVFADKPAGYRDLRRVSLGIDRNGDGVAYLDDSEEDDEAEDDYGAC